MPPGRAPTSTSAGASSAAAPSTPRSGTRGPTPSTPTTGTGSPGSGRGPSTHGERFKSELRYLHPDGVSTSVYCETVPILDDGGDIAGWIGSAMDVTAELALREGLRDSEARFRLLVEHSPDVVVRISLHPWRIDYVSPSIVNLTGRVPDEFYADPGLLISHIHPDDLGPDHRSVDVAVVHRRVRDPGDRRRRLGPHRGGPAQHPGRRRRADGGRSDDPRHHPGGRRATPARGPGPPRRADRPAEPAGADVGARRSPRRTSTDLGDLPRSRRLQGRQRRARSRRRRRPPRRRSPSGCWASCARATSSPGSAATSSSSSPARTTRARSPTGSSTSSRCLRAGRTDVTVGVSVGITNFDWTGSLQQAEALLHQADQAMYEAKRRGKGQVVIAP